MKIQKIFKSFKNKTAIITGGASGIGKALAMELALHGTEVIIADLQLEQAKKVELEIKDSKGKAKAVEINVTDYNALEELVCKTKKRTGRIDFIFNNAGIGIYGNLDNYTLDDWNYIIDVNLKGVTNGVQAVYKIMKAQGYGHIINTASLAGLIPTPGMPSYAATKHAVVGLSTSLRGALAQYGIKVSVLCPGFIRTDILKGGKYGRILENVTKEMMDKVSTKMEKFKPMLPKFFAKKALKDIYKNKPIMVIPAKYKLFWRINRFFPNFSMAILQKDFEKNG